ncbi:two-component system response regulator [filamentous cyanobacterium CCP2]|nr:two-component system response regulator [filamentous cyanobacterium CCP2]
MTGRVFLLAEDNRADVLLTQRAFRALGFPHVLQIVDHGEAAIDYLAGQGAYDDRDRHPFPALLLLDLKMPRKTGFEVMEWLQQQQLSIQVPIVVLSTSNNQIEIDRAYGLGATSYLLKPLTSSMLANILQTTGLL